MRKNEIDEAMRPYIEKEKKVKSEETEQTDESQEEEVSTEEETDNKKDESSEDGIVEVNGIRKFKLGDYYFDSFHEYRNGQADLKKIQLIEDKIDMKDPNLVLRLYQTIRDGEITFKTKIGEDYFSHIGDLVADKSVGLLKDKEVVDTAEKKVRPQRYIGMVTITAAVVLFSYFGFNQLDDYLNTRRLKDLQAQTTTQKVDRAGKASEEKSAELKNGNPFKHKKTVDEKKLTVLKDYREMKAQNKNLIGWLRIDGTDINYPVMQSKDNSYYLTHSFDGKNSTAGALFMDYRSDAVNPTTNTIIYGHNMNNGSMFGSLKNFLSEKYFNQHSKIKFDTIYEHREYELVAVCLAKVKASKDNTFRYYNFIQANNENEWNAFTESVGAMVVNGGMSVKAGDELLTLSTCNNYIEDGRLFLLAKRVEG
ncbi:MAG: class B sortase [bacterium LCO1.1]|uniref:Class B sortase n=1 Tax=Candidatus Weimeria bifida TaxID=2599074 RepID=A0A6N7J2F4_9FIRM|nr:class B sortase [Candidatus Weimeria bifida]